MNYETIKNRYMASYITDAQLERFKNLGIITQQQYDLMIAEKNGENK